MYNVLIHVYLTMYVYGKAYCGCPLLKAVSPDSPLSLQLGARVVLTILHLFKHNLGRQMDSVLMDTLNDLFELVCRSNTTRLRAGTMVSSLLSCDEEMDLRRRQKYESIIEEMKNVRGWGGGWRGRGGGREGEGGEGEEGREGR